MRHLRAGTTPRQHSAGVTQPRPDARSRMVHRTTVWRPLPDLQPQAEPIMTKTALTARQREILRHLRFREAGQTDPTRQVCWLGQLPWNRWLLIVPLMHSEWAPSPFRMKNSTVEELKTQGLIECGPEQELPQHLALSRTMLGSTVRLTNAGRSLAKVHPPTKPNPHCLRKTNAQRKSRT